MSDDDKPLPPAFPPPKPFDLEKARERDAVSPWKKDWEGPGEPLKPEDMPTYGEWRRGKKP